MLAERKYFEDRIASVDATFRKYDGKFVLGTIAKKSQDKAYIITPGQTVSGPLDDQEIEDLMDWTVQLIFKGSPDRSEEIDDAIEIARLVRKESVKPVNSMTGVNIKNVICNSIAVEDAENSDNTITITLEFTLRLKFST